MSDNYGLMIKKYIIPWLLNSISFFTRTGGVQHERLFIAVSITHEI